MNEQLHSLPEAAQLLGISRQYAWMLARDGTLPSTVIGNGNIRVVSNDELRNFASERGFILDTGETE